MIPLDQLEAHLREEVAMEEEDWMRIIQENAIDGEVFRKAAAEGYFNVVEFLLHAKDKFVLSSAERDRCLNEGAADSEGTTPLHLAASRGHCEIVECLISLGAVVDIENDNVETPLYMACREGQEGALNMLLKYNASPDRYSWRDNKWPIEIAAARGHSGIVRILLQIGVRIDGALHFAVDGSHEDLVSLILLHNPHHPNHWNDGMTALHRATMKGHVGICELLLKANANVSPLDNSGLTPLHIASSNGCIEIVQLLLYYRARVDGESWAQTPLHCAVSGGHMAIVQLLLECNAPINVWDWRHQTPLDIAIEMKHKDIALFLRSRGGHLNDDYHLEAVIGRGRLLALLSILALRSDSNTMGYNTALHIACRCNQLEIVRFLLRTTAQSDIGSGASSLQNCRSAHLNVYINAANSDGETPLHLSTLFSLQNLLIDKGADPNIPDKRGQTPLHKTRNIQFVNLLLKCNVLVDSRDQYGRTPLSYACADFRKDIVELLTVHGASVNTRDQNTETPLYMSLKHRAYNIAKFLHDNEADINMRYGAKGRTLLHIASSHGDEEGVRLLLEWDGDVEAKDMSGDTPLQLAVEAGEVSTAKLLINHGASVRNVVIGGRNAKYEETMKIVQLLFQSRADGRV